ncbi:tetratricopeptide repeat protein [Streptomyces sp. FH025]|uniref:tetratricopeptide repeat protein n=1 Tax=Streptomyces sp. FH025 TaxID=2815937 RepID=UPI001A9D914F|nr:tetratricopeptide repeat protein [Streptomyces sp. FH025]MBO1413228.1 tetratricopeptide repeat protein [Streptomyces sp. FH025]
MEQQEVTNRITGQVGTAVMAGTINGGIHIQPTPPPPSPPRQLRAVPRVFTDRAEALDALNATRSPLPEGTAPVIVIHGDAGVGRRTLAARWARQLADEFPDGQLVAPLSGGPTGRYPPVAEIVRRLLGSLGLGVTTPLPGHTDDLLALWRSATASRRLLLVLEEATTDQGVVPLVPANPGCLIVVTSRTVLPALAAHGAHHLHLSPLAPGHALVLLRRIIGEKRVAAEPHAAVRLVEACGGLPLALGLAGGELALNPARTLTDHVELSPPQPGALSVTITNAIDQMPDEQRRLLADIAQLPAPDLDGHTVAASTATPVSRTTRLLEELSARHLLDRTGDVAGRGPVYAIRPEVADRALALNERAGTGTTVVQRYLDFLTATAYETGRILTPHHRVLEHSSRHEPAEPVRFADDTSALGWLEVMASALLPALDAATKHGEHRAATCVVHAAWPLFHYTRRYEELWIPAHRQGLAAAERWGDTMGIREMLSTLAAGLRGMRSYDEAISCLRRALTLAEGDLEGIAQYTSGIGACLHADGRYAESMPHLVDAAARYERLGRARGQGLALILIGSAHARQGEPATGVPVLQEARMLLSALTDPDLVNAARAEAFLGEAHSLAGEHDLAAAALVQALEQFRSFGVPYWTAHVMEFLGQAAIRGGQRKSALEWYGTSLDHYTELASRHDIARLQRRISAVPGPAAQLGG